jgi:chromate transporter
MPAADQPERVSFREALGVWAKIGFLSFGGPAGQIALMHHELVEKRKWIDERRFLHALNYCMLLPGPEAQQLATYIGWMMHRTRGGLAAGLLFVLPGFFMMLGLSAVYVGLGDVPAVAALLFGLKAAVLAVVVEAVHRIGKRALRTPLLVGVAALAFVSIFFFEVPFPLVVLAAGLFGLTGAPRWPSAFSRAADAVAPDDAKTVIGRMAAEGELGHTRPSVQRALRVFVVCSVVWVLPLVVLAATLGRGTVLVEEGIFFSKTAMVTFGGAYAVLAYVAQRTVEDFGWLRPGEMLDGLGLAETTPGPLILVLEFVGFLAAHRNPGSLPPMLAGLAGATMTVWVTFAPCFLWIFLGAPYIESLRGNRSLSAALSAITAAVVGVILNLSLWFGLHLLFPGITEKHFGPLRVFVPDAGRLDVAALLLSAFAMLALFRFKLGLPKTLAASALLGAAWKLLARP